MIAKANSQINTELGEGGIKCISLLFETKELNMRIILGIEPCVSTSFVEDCSFGSDKGM